MNQGNQMKRILKYYSAILVVAITVFAISICGLQVIGMIREAKNTVSENTNQLNAYVSMNENRLYTISQELTTPRKRMNNVLNYFKLDYDDYLAETLSKSGNEFLEEDFYYLPSLARNKVFFAYDNVTDFSLQLKNYEDIFYASEANKLGTKVKKVPIQPEAVHLYRNLEDQDSSETIGTLHLGLKKSEFNSIIDSVVKDFDMSVFAISDTGQIIYNYSNYDDSSLNRRVDRDLQKKSSIALSALEADYYLFSLATSRQIQVISAIPKKSVIFQSLKLFSFFLLGSIALDGILISVLFFLFTRYEKQVKQIVTGVKSIGDDGLGKRIPEGPQKAELLEITVGINQMLDRINQYVVDLYRLEIKQKDAHMKALQSQINPHFLYNTLEYIRMYAVSIGADELAEVVFSFASLMRNNISPEKKSSIQNELEFCEKYVYLYQMRYPNKIAYYFSVEKSLEELVLPKFSIQPLVENYFVHGIDYTRMDNAIRVKAFKKDGKSYIEIADNGKGMTKEELVKTNQKLQVNHSEFSDSIGLTNVNERLKAHFGQTYSMILSETKGGGLTVKLVFQAEDTREAEVKY